MFPNLGGQELFIILFLALLLFGAKRLPEVGAGLGKGIRAFKESLKAADVKEDLEKLEEKNSPSATTNTSSEEAVSKKA
ncbi:twin-arginine translocase TatA/TatE family subunit [Thermodesulfobacterium hydrogeniphilum]|uniref:twin-arginine translocase TatA/TatE family subunit n=1 Tax=Thermodesulfobacterium hydrogeniphilum TaxID=161156 RepID=UPI000571ABB0|nr:twin-arginine translocase TatA/TatE family subunit [Thermodesulfobacterium hydrogeniphilum]